METMFPLFVFGGQIREYLKTISKEYFVTEVRLRLNQPLGVAVEEGYRFVLRTGALAASSKGAYMVTEKDLAILFQKLTQFSVYAFSEELGEGFLTLPGGHRVGICGKMIYQDNGKKVLRDITSFNIRIAHQVTGCADDFYCHLLERDSFLSTLIFSPPGCGKTTLLRELIRRISTGGYGGRGQNVGVVDERSEIGNYGRETTGFDLGPRTDLLDHCLKSRGMLLLLRTMSPEVIAADEIGDVEDIEAIKYVRFCGCSLLLTVHGEHLEELLNRPYLGEYLRSHPFRRYLRISGRDCFTREIKIYDETQKEIWRGTAKGRIERSRERTLL